MDYSKYFMVDFQKHFYLKSLDNNLYIQHSGFHSSSKISDAYKKENQKRTILNLGGVKMEHVKEVTHSAKCPKCEQEFKIDVECGVLLSKGNIDRDAGIGYLMQLKCNECGIKFPYFRRTAEGIEIMNSVIDNNKKLIEQGIVGNTGVGSAQQMLSGLDAKGMTSYFAGMLKKKQS